MPSSLAIGAGNETAALDAGVVAFEPMQDAHLYPEHNQMNFYTWGDADCCLPTGATQATLAGAFPNLQVGDILVFKEVLGPQTGVAGDADIRHRCAVRLTAVATQDGRGNPLVDPLFEQGTGLPIRSAAQLPTPVTQIRWADDDALAFPLCLSSTFLDATGAKQIRRQCQRRARQCRARRSGADDAVPDAAAGPGADSVQAAVEHGALRSAKPRSVPAVLPPRVCPMRR